jgi:hypothetical protein
MDRQDPHLSLDLIMDFAYGLTLLQPGKFRHFQDCDQCSTAWWRLKQETKRERSETTPTKSMRTISAQV